MTPLERFWRMIVLKSLELGAFWVIFAHFTPFSAENTRNTVVLVVFAVILAIKTVHLVMAILGYMSIKARVKKEAMRRGRA